MDNFINFAEYSYFRIMYDYIKGRIEELNPTEAVIECCGIGYLMQISLNTYEKIRDAGDTRLYVYHHVREDEETLYGFFDKEERRIFILLISVSGIGPNTATKYRAAAVRLWTFRPEVPVPIQRRHARLWSCLDLQKMLWKRPLHPLSVRSRGSVWRTLSKKP